MRIALVSEHANPLAALGGVDAGGQNVHVAALAAGLTALGHDVTVHTRRDEPDAPDRLRAPEGYAVELVPAGPATRLPKDDLLPHMPAFADHLAARWQEEPFDVAHAHFWMSGLATVSAARRVDVPVVQTFHALGTVKRRHQGERDPSPRTRIPLERRLCRDADRVVATCTDEVAELVAMGMPPGRATVIPCGVDVDLFRPKAVRRDCRPRVLYAGRIVERKGIGNVIEAVAQLPGVELVVAGGPPPEQLGTDPDAQRLRAVAASFGVDDRVTLLGAVPHERLPGLMCTADVVVSVPWYEPFGILPVEAMACGRPVVGSAVGGLLDTVVPGVTGELVPPRRPDLLAGCLRTLLADEDLRARYGRAGRRRALAGYRWEQVAASTEALYDEVAAGGVPAAVGATARAVPAGGAR